MTNRRRERRSTYPFEVAVDAFEDMALRLDPSTDYDPSKSSFDLEMPAGDPEPLRISVQLSFNRRGVLQQLSRDAQDLEVVLIEEQPWFRRNTIRGQWPITSTPPEFEFEIGTAGFGEREFRIRVAAVLARTIPDAPPGRAHRRGSTFAERTFTLRVPSSKSLFPVENTSFKDEGWDRNALWYCDFTGLDNAAEAPPDEVVTVHLNKDHDALQALCSPSASRHVSRGPAAAMIKPLINFGILSEVVSTLLVAHARDPDREIESDSMLDLLSTSLSRTLGLELDQAMDLAVHQPGELSRLLQDLTGLGKRFNRQSLSRIDGLEEVGERQ